MKIPFDIKFRPQIESGEYIVITESGYPVKIYRWDYKDKEGTPILGSYVQEGYEYAAGWYIDGKFNAKPSNLDLVLVANEPLTPLAQALSDYLKNDFEFFATKKWDEKKWNEVMNTQAAELLELAKKELCKDCTEKQCNDYRYEGPTPHTWFPPCYHGGPCTNPMHDCINCPRQSTSGINTTTGTSTAKLEG